MVARRSPQRSRRAEPVKSLLAIADKRVMSYRCQNCKRVVRKPEAIKACQCPYCNERWGQPEPAKANLELHPKSCMPSKTDLRKSA